jgi:hypothetical protein
MTILAQDTFIKSNISGSFGTASDGNTYTHDGTNQCALAVTSNEGTCIGGGLGIGDYMYIGTGTSAPVNVLVRCATDTNAAYMGVTGRYQGSETGYIAYLHNQTVNIDSVSSDTRTSIASTAFSYGANQFCWIRLICQGTTISATVWLDGNAEPGTPTLSATNATISAAGKYGIFASNGGGTSQFDHLTVTNNAGSTINLVTQAEAKFFVRANQQTQTRAKFLTRAKLGTTARSKFVTRLALTSSAWSQFLINQVIAPPTHFISATWVTRDMQATWKTRDGKITWKTRQ